MSVGLSKGTRRTMFGTSSAYCRSTTVSQAWVMAWHPDDGLRFDKALKLSPVLQKHSILLPFVTRHHSISSSALQQQQPNYSRYSISSIRRSLRNLPD